LPAIVPLAVSIRVELSGPSASGSRLDFRAAFLGAKLAVFTLTEIGGVIDRLRTAGASPDRPTFHSLVTGSQTLFGYIHGIGFRADVVEQSGLSSADGVVLDSIRTAGQICRELHNSPV
jgi:hypothetical protein